MKVLFRLVDSRSGGSFSLRLRRRRFKTIWSLMSQKPMPMNIIDVGGEQIFWELMGVAGNPNLNFLILNIEAEETTLPNFSSAAGDATDMREFGDRVFDLVFSNSCIEHVGGYRDQEGMAREIRRIGRDYILQTPNRYFPIEPHHLFPFFNFLPLRIKVILLCRFRITHSQKKMNQEEALRVAQEIRLLSFRELRRLFPDARIERERFLGMTKSFIVSSIVTNATSS